MSDKEAEAYMKGVHDAYNILLKYRHPRDIENGIRNLYNDARARAGYESLDPEA